MRSLRPSPLRRVGLHFARVVALSGALAALTTLVVADVFAAESEAGPAVAIDEEVEAEEVGFLTLMARPFAPDAATPAEPLLPEVPELAREDAPRKKRSPKKLKMGRFEGY